jgi:hypothetical protein
MTRPSRVRRNCRDRCARGRLHHEELDVPFDPLFSRCCIAMGFLKSLADGLNYQEVARKDYQPRYFDRNVVRFISITIWFSFTKAEMMNAAILLTKTSISSPPANAFGTYSASAV